MNIEITVNRLADEELFKHLNTSSLSGNDPFPIDIMDKEYLAVPKEVLTTGDSVRARVVLVEEDQ